MSQINSTATGGGASRATLTAFFDHRHHAEDAVNRLIDAGISRDSIRLVPGYENDEAVPEQTTAHRGFFEYLADFFMPDEDRYSYAEGLSRGGFLVTVSALSGDLYDTALDILDDEGAINLDEREASWRSEGWTGYQTGSYADTEPASGYNSDRLSASADDLNSYAGASGATSAGSAYGSAARGTLGSSNEEVIPVVEEQLLVGKRDMNNGRVRVRSYVREEPVSEQVSLRDEHVSVERRSVDRALSGTETAFQDREIEAEEHSEQAVISKEARVTEEIALHKESDVHQETVTDTVRHTEVEIDDERGTTRNSGTFDRRS